MPRASFVRLEPAHGEGELLVYAPYAWAGNLHNSSQRYQAIANLCGFTLLAASAPGTGRVIIDGPTRRSLRSNTLHDVAKRHANDFANTFQDDQRPRIVMGDSGRAPLAAWMGVMAPPNTVDAVLTRDGVNLLDSNMSWLRGATHLLKHASDTTEDVYIQRPHNPFRLAHTVLCAVSEMYYYGPLMCGDDSTAALRALATKAPSITFASVMFENGLSGPGLKARLFNEQLREDRMQMENAAPFVGIYEPGAHGDLMSIPRTARHLGEVATALYTYHTQQAE